MNYVYGSPGDRGRADKYYGRPKSPHKYPNGTHLGNRTELTDPVEIAEYLAGYKLQLDRKEW